MTTDRKIEIRKLNFGPFASANPGDPVEFEIEQGWPVAVRFLDQAGHQVNEVRFRRVYDRENKIVDVFYSNCFATRLATYDKVTIKGFQLQSKGALKLGARLWANFLRYPYHMADIDVEKGKVVEVRILDSKGRMIGEARKMGRIETQDGNLLEVFYDTLRPSALDKLDNEIIRNVQLQANGALHFSKRFWGIYRDHPSEYVDLEIAQGKVAVVHFRRPDGTWTTNSVKFSTVCDMQGHLLDTFRETLGPSKWPTGDAVIKGMHLTKWASLDIGGRHWGFFKSFAESDIEIVVKQGMIVELRAIDPDGQITREPIQLTQMIDAKGRIIDVAYGAISPERLEAMDGITIKPVFLNSVGGFSLGSHRYRFMPPLAHGRAEVYIEKGKIAWVRAIQDHHGRTISTRTGVGFGRAQQRELFSHEIRFRDLLATGLKTAGLDSDAAMTAADTLVRLRDKSLNLLVQEGVLKREEMEAIQYLQTNNLDIPSLGRRLAQEIAQYQSNGLDTRMRKWLFGTHLLPWSFIERMQRTYHLGRATWQLRWVAGASDIEGALRRFRETQGSRGRLDQAKHLSYYDREKNPTGDQARRIQLLAEFRVRRDALQALYSSSPDARRYTFSVVQATPKAITLRISNDERIDPRQGQRVLFVETGLTGVVQGLALSDHLVTLSVGGMTEKIQNGTLLVSNADVPLELQIAELSKIIRSLGVSKLQTTGSPALDRLLGLTSLTPSHPNNVYVKKFFNSEIPYRQLSEYQSAGDQSQEMAVRLAMDPTEVEFIEGPPGTGKTTVIAEIIRQAVGRGQRVLLVSQMHQAVDNALAEVMDDPAVPCLRVGNSPESFGYGTQKVWARDMQAVRRFSQRRSLGRGYVIAGTNIGVATERNIGLDAREMQFDLVIMDEASRETLTGALVPLSFLSPKGKVIFVGDIKQLPPFRITEEQQRQANLSDDQVRLQSSSVLEDLLPQGYGERVMLSTNYRSHPLIAGLVSQLFYNGDVHRRGWEDFDTETLSLRVIDIADEPDTYYEERVGSSYRNRQSAQQVLNLVALYKRRGVALPEITVITPYLAQVEYLQAELKKIYGKQVPEVTTIDAYQGGENETVIFDFVRSNPQKQIGFIKDRRRLNVGLSRAKENLAIVWDSRTLTEEPKNQTPEDAKARQLFEQIENYYDTEVRTFFPESEEKDMSSLNGDDSPATNQSTFGAAIHAIVLSVVLKSLAAYIGIEVPTGFMTLLQVGALLASMYGLYYNRVRLHKNLRNIKGLLMSRRTLSAA